MKFLLLQLTALALVADSSSVHVGDEPPVGLRGSETNHSAVEVESNKCVDAGPQRTRESPGRFCYRTVGSEYSEVFRCEGASTVCCRPGGKLKKRWGECTSQGPRDGEEEDRTIEGASVDEAAPDEDPSDSVAIKSSPYEPSVGVGLRGSESNHLAVEVESNKCVDAGPQRSRDSPRNFCRRMAGSEYSEVFRCERASTVCCRPGGKLKKRWGECTSRGPRDGEEEDRAIEGTSVDEAASDEDSSDSIAIEPSPAGQQCPADGIQACKKIDMECAATKELHVACNGSDGTRTVISEGAPVEEIFAIARGKGCEANFWKCVTPGEATETDSAADDEDADLSADDADIDSSDEFEEIEGDQCTPAPELASSKRGSMPMGQVCRANYQKTGQTVPYTCKKSPGYACCSTDKDKIKTSNVGKCKKAAGGEEEEAFISEV